MPAINKVEKKTDLPRLYFCSSILGVVGMAVEIPLKKSIITVQCPSISDNSFGMGKTHQILVNSLISVLCLSHILCF